MGAVQCKHQDGHRHAAQHRARRAAQQHFAHAGMTISAHHDEIGAEVGGTRQQHLPDRQTGGHGPFDLRLDGVARQMQRDVCTGQFAVSVRSLARIDRQHGHQVG
jgi:hypothetical protein